MTRTPGSRLAGILVAILLMAVWIPSSAAASSLGSPRGLPTNCKVTFRPGQAHIIPDTVRHSAANTVFCFESGVFRMRDRIQAANGDRFIGSGSGAGGTTLTGSLHIVDWGLAGGLFVHMGDVPPTPPLGGRCASGTACQYSDWLYNASGPLRRVLYPCTSSNVTAGAFCVDYSTSKLFVHDDPATAHLEYATARAAFGGTGINVTISHLSVVHFASPAHVANTISTEDGWIIDDVDASANHSCAIGIHGAAVVIENSRLHANGQDGFCGGGTNDVIKNNDVGENNALGFDPWWDAAGGKVCRSVNIIVTGNTFRSNNAMGLWFDCDNDGPTITNNVFSRNRTGGSRGTGDGLHLGLSCNGTVTSNISDHNAGAGIILRNSFSITVGQSGAGNTVTDNIGGGILIDSTSRPGHSQYCYWHNNSSNDHVMYNTISMPPGLSRNGMTNRGGNVTGDSFTGNRYAMPGPDCSAHRWVWNQGTTNPKVPFSGSGTTWQGTFGQDKSGSCRRK